MFVFVLMPSSIDRTPSTIYAPPISRTIEPPQTVPVNTSIFEPFPFPPELEPQVNFWKTAFTEYTTKQVLIHDAWYMNVIYEVINLDDPEYATQKDGWKAVASAQEKYTKLLTTLAEHWDVPRQMTQEERRVYELFQDIPESSSFEKKDAKDRVRAQVGQSDRMEEGLIRAGRYLNAMKAIFAEYGLPENLVYLSLIESAFNPYAESFVGAAGVWQFMRGTGKEYDLTINSVLDERKDPLKSTRAAAQLLAHNYESTQSWPLAITAYNHGLQGIKNAVRDMQSEDIGTIVEQYDGSRFGFASRNFYVEFLAALDIGLRYTEYFGEIDLAPPTEILQVRLPDYISAKTLEKYYIMTVDEIKALNPALHRSIYTSGNFLPKNYELNLLPEQKINFDARYAAIPDALKFAYLPVKATHRVTKGQSLAIIAKRYRTSIKAIMNVNGMKSRKIKAGQVLKIPGGYVAIARESSIPAPAARTRASNTAHQVAKGETLSDIAEKYRSSVNAIMAANSIVNPQTITIGQTLEIPQQSQSTAQKKNSSRKDESSNRPTQTAHKVKRGQTLDTIAKIHNTSATAIARLNNIKNPRKIKAGQLLKIPKG